MNSMKKSFFGTVLFLADLPGNFFPVYKILCFCEKFS